MPATKPNCRTHCAGFYRKPDGGWFCLCRQLDLEQGSLRSHYRECLRDSRVLPRGTAVYKQALLNLLPAHLSLLRCLQRQTVDHLPFTDAMQLDLLCEQQQLTLSDQEKAHVLRYAGGTRTPSIPGTIDPSRRYTATVAGDQPCMKLDPDGVWARVSQPETPEPEERW